jgi:hypothetical protein
VAPPEAPAYPPIPLTPPPGEPLEAVAQALAAAHGLKGGRKSASAFWECDVCHTAGFGAGVDAAIDHFLHVRRRAAEKATAAAAAAEQENSPS